jgi:ketosteroid isomerase-like protein
MAASLLETMSRENVEILLRASEQSLAAERPQDREVFFEFLSPDVEWDASRDVVLDVQGVYHGVEGVRDYFVRWASAWEDWRWEYEELRPHGDQVLARIRLRARGRHSGLTLDRSFGQLWTFRDGRAIRYEAFPSWEEALEAAGLVE